MIRMRLFLLLPLLAVSLAAWSFPTLYGETGLVLIPTADVLPMATFEGAVDYVNVTGAAKTRAIPVRLTFGFADHTEVALMVSESREGDRGFDLTGGAVKMALLDEEDYTYIPGVAVGLHAARFKEAGKENIDVVDGYLVLSKAVLSRGTLDEGGFVIRAHAGIGSTTYSGGASGSFFAPFGGMSYYNGNGNFMSLELLPGAKKGGVTLRQTTLSAVMRRPLSDNFFLEVGMTRPFGGSPFNQPGSNTAFAGIMYRYCERENDRPTIIGY